MTTIATGADKKAGEWITQRVEDRYLRPFLLRLVPRSIETYHLTLMTIGWSIGVLGASYLSRQDMKWLWLASVCILGQYVTDLLDGAVGRQRKTGLVKWGYYMDHFLDYIFFSSIILGYAFIFPGELRYYFIAIALVQLGFFINTILAFAATNSFSISFARIGPTEVRLVYILFNAYLIFFGTTLPEKLMPGFAALMLLSLACCVYRTQREMWRLDMAAKRAS